jgi:hypothetical protein
MLASTLVDCLWLDRTLCALTSNKTKTNGKMARDLLLTETEKTFCILHYVDCNETGCDAGRRKPRC